MRDLKQDVITIHNRKYLIFVVTLKQRKEGALPLTASPGFVFNSLWSSDFFFCLGLASLANWRYLSFQYSNVKIEKLLKTPFSPINCLTNTKKCLSNVYQIAKKNRRTFKLAVKHLFDYWSYVRLERFFYSRVIRGGDKYYCLHHTCNCVRERSRRNPKVLALYLPPNRLSGRY